MPTARALLIAVLLAGAPIYAADSVQSAETSATEWYSIAWSSSASFSQSNSDGSETTASGVIQGRAELAVTQLSDGRRVFTFQGPEGQGTGETLADGRTILDGALVFPRPPDVPGGRAQIAQGELVIAGDGGLQITYQELSHSNTFGANIDRVFTASGRATARQLSPVQQFVSGLHEVIVGRPPSDAEIDAWIEQWRTAPDDAEVSVQGLVRSDEYAGRPLTVGERIRMLYRAVLQRSPTAGEIESWLPFVQERFNALVPGFVGSAEFVELAGRVPAEAIVRRFYREFLGRVPASAEVTAWVAFLGTRGDWHSAAVGFLSSPEFLAIPQSLEGHVTTLYRALLDREPAAAERDAWVTHLVDRLAAVDETFIASPEFQQHARLLLRQ